jgi:hypothetical protein
MSTKSTIAYGTNFHLYHETLDEDYVYLELEGVRFEAGYNRLMVPIPMHIWEFIRHYPGADLEWADKTDAQIQEHVEHEIDDRLKRYAEVDDDRKGFVSLLGSMVYGKADEPREEQITSGIAYFTKQREHQQQIKQAIRDLEEAAKKNGHR